MWKYQNTDELYHHGVLGMRWGHRKSQYITKKASKRKNKYLSKTKNASNIHFNNSKTYKQNANKLSKMSDAQYAKMFDDKEYLKTLGGAKKAKQKEIKNYTNKYKSSVKYGKDWLNAHNEIMKIPVDRITSKKEYNSIINKHLNS